MPKVARVDDTISNFTTGSGQCSKSYSYTCGCDEYGCDTCIGYYYSSASGTGKVNGGSESVYVNNKKMAHVDSTTSETATCPSGYSGSSSGNGRITAGNSAVFVNGKQIAANGSTVRTHTSHSSSVNSGSDNVYVGGS